MEDSMQRTWLMGVLVGLILIGLGLGVAHPVQAAVTTVSGRIFDDISGAGIANVTVCLAEGDDPLFCSFQTTTNSSGTYSFTEELADGFPYTVFFPGTDSYTLNFAPTKRTFGVPLGGGTFVIDFVRPTPHVYTKTEEIAHRGDRITSPENTYIAIERAIEKESSYIEIDVFLGDLGDSNPSNDIVYVSHGSQYKATGGPPDAPTQVYGPTPFCQGVRLETYSGWDLVRNPTNGCDVGTEMINVGQTWDPVFRYERIPFLSEVLERYTDDTVWMIELKETEIPGLSDAQRAARNQLLGQKVQGLVVPHLNSGVIDEVWVTSFNDDALSAVTDARIFQMRQVYPDYWGNAGMIGEVDNAIVRGYEALNLDFSLPDTQGAFGATWGEYIHQKGLRFSVYTLIGAQTEAQHSDSIANEADFFMTDILDHMLVLNGDRPVAHPLHTVEFQPEPNTVCRSVFANEEVFDITVRLRMYSYLLSSYIVYPPFTDAEGYLVTDVPALGRFDYKYNPTDVTQTIIEPIYTEPVITPTEVITTNVYSITPTAAQILAAGVRYEITAESQEYPNVDPRIRVEPCVGDGDVKVALRWSTVADLDLYVTDPAGEIIYYGNPTSASGGQLDVDANAGCSDQTTTPVENIFWETGTAPAGTYGVQVYIWSTCDVPASPFSVTVTMGDSEETYQFPAGETNFTFEYTPTTPFAPEPPVRNDNAKPGESFVPRPPK
jgi:hypothetical protein